MRVIIVGAGSVGSHLAGHLSRENHDVTMIEKDRALVKTLQDQLDILVLEGNGASPALLEKAGIERCDLLMAVTNSDETNMITGLAAAQFNVPFKIARVSNTDYYLLDNWLNEKSLGLDLLINPDLQCALQIKSLLEVPGASDVAEFGGGQVLLVGLTVQERASCIGRSLQEIRLKMDTIDFLVVSITRAGETIIPTGQTTMQAGDQAYMICKKEALDQAYDFCGLTRKPVHRAMVLGGSKVAIYLCKMLEKAKIRGTLIETKEELAEQLAGELDDTLVIQGDATDVELLEQEGLNEVDAFLALTPDDEDNLLTGLIARNHRVPVVVALLEKLDYVPLVNKVGVTTAVSSRLAAVDTILKYVRRGNILSLATLKNNRAEIIEFIVTERCKLIDKPIKDLKIKPKILFGMITRGREVFMPTGFSQLQVGDKVVVIGRPETQRQLESLFQ
ncbi:MAG: Trk system potassium transporter TrkA [Acidobacteria bacterium]|nr:Trk system potassium transporter TrkA [Acidobacteriota bacterium]MCB9396324.1 Trk system potassium transporter TrkA [Acidobacteriota bacterium]